MDNSQGIKKKINIFGKVGKIITIILIVCMYIAEGALVAGTIVTAILPKDAVTLTVNGSAHAVIDGSFVTVDQGDSKLDFKVGNFAVAGMDDENADIRIDGSRIDASFRSGSVTYDLWDALRICIAGIFAVAGVLVALYFLKSLMKELAVCDTPFCSGVVTKMRSFAIALIPAAIAGEVANTIIGATVSHCMSIGFSVNLGMIALVVVIFLLSMIFGYGAQLQKQYDETV